MLYFERYLNNLTVDFGIIRFREVICEDKNESDLTLKKKKELESRREGQKNPTSYNAAMSYLIGARRFVSRAQTFTIALACLTDDTVNR